jgi:hypothetical protein
MSVGRLWLGIVLAPLAWLVYLQTAYALVPLACRRPTAGMIGLPVIAVVAVALGAAAALTAWRSWRRIGAMPSPPPTPTARAHFMALTGLGTSAFFLLVLIAGIVPLFFLPPCQ